MLCWLVDCQETQWLSTKSNGRSQAKQVSLPLIEYCMEGHCSHVLRFSDGTVPEHSTGTASFHIYQWLSQLNPNTFLVPHLVDILGSGCQLLHIAPPGIARTSGGSRLLHVLLGRVEVARLHRPRTCWKNLGRTPNGWARPLITVLNVLEPC